MANFEQTPVAKKETESAEKKIEALSQQIFELEQKKQEILAQIDQLTETAKTQPKKEREAQSGVSFLEFAEGEEVKKAEYIKQKKKGVFQCKAYDGQMMEISQSDMLTDMRWGVFYDLSDNIVAKDHFAKYNEFRKKYVEAYFNHKIQELITKQLLIQRLEIDDVGHHDMFIAKAYQELMKGGNQEKAGFIFEKMISGVLQKMAIDLGEKYGFEYEEASVVDDVELKADCLVKIKGKKEQNQAVGVEESSEIKGIQLTLRKEGDPDFERKKQQVAKVKERLLKGGQTKINDLILLQVSIDNPEIMGAYKEWKNHDKQSGGPEKMFDGLKLVNEILRGIFQGTELDFETNEEFRQAVYDYFKKNNFRI